MMTAIEASFIIVSLKVNCLKSPTKNPSEKSAGIVLSPKMSITKAPDIGLPVLAAVTAKK